MIRAVVVLAVLACAAVAAVDAAAVQRRTGGVRRIGRRTAAQQQVTCSADAMERAMERARAGDQGWWDDVKSGLSTAVDAINVVKGWECRKCPLCTEHAQKFGADLVQTLVKEALDTVGTGAICASTFDVIAMTLCSGICLPIPVPGLTPLVCPPFVVFAHSQCSDLIGEVLNEIKKSPALVAAQKAKKLAVGQISALKPENVCKKLGLCPRTRTDCN